MCQAKASARGARNGAPALTRAKAPATIENYKRRRILSAPTLRRKQRQRRPPQRPRRPPLRPTTKLTNWINLLIFCPGSDATVVRKGPGASTGFASADNVTRHKLHVEFALEAPAAPQLTLTRRPVALCRKQRPLPRCPSTTTSATFSRPRCRGVVGGFAAWLEHLPSKGRSNAGAGPVRKGFDVLAFHSPAAWQAERREMRTPRRTHFPSVSWQC